MKCTRCDQPVMSFNLAAGKRIQHKPDAKVQAVLCSYCINKGLTMPNLEPEKKTPKSLAVKYKKRTRIKL